MNRSPRDRGPRRRRWIGAGALLASALATPALGQPADGLAWSGSTDRRTEPFTVTTEWRLRWELGSPPGFVPRLQVWAHPAGGPASVQAIVDREGIGEGSSPPMAPGTYVLEVIATNADWALTVDTGDAAGPGARRTDLTQACVGSPVPVGGASIFGGVGFTDGANAYTLGVTQNPHAPAGYRLSATYVDFDDVDEAGYGFAGSVAIEAVTAPVGICPVVGVGYSKIEDFDAHFWSFPIGIALGGGIVAENGVQVVPFVAPQLLILHARGFGETETDTEAALELGLTIGGGALFGTFGVGISSAEASDPTFSVVGGVTF